ncbi:uncharacterized protein EV422DRAFT_613562 [Fimicolochytrium jonesii]|uniref:uncharacterized protein n=1 Tax=Fimicolochytrium jonesii TaxID=1396493 RepID=UPI0022FE2C8A|nr:uncharacterized protein EV422DRAFT_613562 [Fimicolochytrium jonesii]KAI8822448.1 hypothetical protein EV422DRAFT_613562 [Fimicolochytrium jonesii]
MASTSRRTPKPAAAVYVPRHRRTDPSTSQSADEIPKDQPPSQSHPSESIHSTHTSRSSSPTPSTPSRTRKGRGQFKSPITVPAADTTATRKKEPPPRVYPPSSSTSQRECNGKGSRGGSGRVSPAASDGRGGAAGMSSSARAEGAVARKASVGEVEDVGRELGRLGLDPHGGTEGGEGKRDEQEDWERLDTDEEEDQTPAAEVAAAASRRVGDWVEDASTTTLDIHSFPPAFRTHDLELIFEDFTHTRGGFRIKWVDDTRALVVFRHPDTARAAYAKALGNPFIRVKPHTGEIPDDGYRTPRSPAPVKSDMVARRLVAGALGMRSAKKTAEEVERDREKLQKARDKIALEKKQREERERRLAAAWDG